MGRLRMHGLCGGRHSLQYVLLHVWKPLCAKSAWKFRKAKAFTGEANILGNFE
jgi:hypothetical protein